ncbi:MAG TPA: serine/threonine-protein kinase [Nocardioidaceae bacterium]|jgi:serine/threonine protein kinase
MTSLLTRRTELDDVDGRPVWSFVEGETLVRDHLAWTRLGIGTRCETWLAWSEPLWSPAIVKLTRPEQVTHPRGRAAVAREADALGAVRHPGLPRLLYDGRAGQVPYLVAQYVDGPDLDHVLEESGPLDEAEAVMLVAQVLSVVRSLHAAGFAHLDLKPENLILQNGCAVLVDLGSSRRIGHRQPSGRPIGTTGYAAPDLERGDDIAASMDVYGLGTVFAEALTGRRLFDPHAPAADRPHPELPGSVSPGVHRLLGDMLRAEPQDRPTIDELLLALPALMGAQDSDELLWPSWASRALSARPGPATASRAGQ